ncbi:MAG TPA: hypothetical protein VHZ24_02795 [Pirellulales bacterium]|jgi:hypothetical protein|nr:hypothetical protein [Pirellulales bacterium]
MNSTESLEKLAGVKLDLAAKYDSLARQSGSRTKQRRMLNQAEKFRQQARELARKKPR